MTETPNSFDLLRHLTWQDVFIVFAVLILASFIVVITRWATSIWFVKYIYNFIFLC